jgi:hypothetical protein
MLISALRQNSCPTEQFLRTGFADLQGTRSAECSTAQGNTLPSPSVAGLPCRLSIWLALVSVLSQIWIGVFKKRNRPSARQCRYCLAARSPVEDKAFCAPHRVVIWQSFAFAWHSCKNRTTRIQISARWCGSPEISSVFLSLTSWTCWI